MNARWRGRLLVAALVVAGTAGCNPLTALWFVLGGPTDKFQPDYALTPPTDKKEAKVLVLTSCSLEVGQDFIGIDRMLASEFTQALNEACKINKEKVTIIPTHKVEKYKQDHPNWKGQDPVKIGKEFEADYVIDLEVLGMSLYQPRSKQLLHGRAVIGVNAYNLNKPDDKPLQTEYDREYPRGDRPVDISDTTPSRFRQEFIQRIAAELSWKFSAHGVSEHFPID